MFFSGLFVAVSLLMEDVYDKIAFSSFFPPLLFLKDNFVIGKVFGQRFPPQHRESFVVEFNYEQKQTRRSMIALRSTMMMVLVLVLVCGGEMVARSSQNYLVCI
jgi:hypothetical protein